MASNESRQYLIVSNNICSLIPLNIFAHRSYDVAQNVFHPTIDDCQNQNLNNQLIVKDCRARFSDRHKRDTMPILCEGF
mgnify:CR=1 FL=1